jgi:MOSC domain-containing protein YiiM
MGTVISIHRVVTKGGPAEALEAAQFIANFGLEGDWRSRQGRGRQITLIETEALEFIASTLQMLMIPPGASRRQVVVEGIALNETVGKRLRVGPLLVEIHDLCDPCRNMEKMIGRGAWWAMKERGGVCGKVIEGGTLRTGDHVSMSERPRATHKKV